MSGYSPVRDVLVLSRGADFVHTYRKHPDDPAFPVGTTAEIVITRNNRTDSPILATWPAEDVSEDEISFWVQITETDVVPERTSWRLVVHYPSPPGATEVQDFVWYRGNVKREQ